MNRSQIVRMCVWFGAATFASAAAAQYAGNIDTTSPGGQNYVNAQNAIRDGENGGIPAAYNLKVGDVYLRTGAGINFSYNDNISLRNDDLQSDFLISPNVRLGFYKPFTRENALRFSLDFGGVFYMNYDEYNHFTLFPNGDNSFEIYAQTDNWSFQLRDTFSLYMSPIVLNHSTGSTDVMQFQNNTYLTGEGDYGLVTTGFVYDHGFYKYWGNDFEYLDRNHDAFNAHAGVRVASPVIVGVDLGVNHTYYDSDDLNDSVGYNVSAYSQFVLSRAISGRAWVGWGWSDFEGGGRYEDYTNYSDIIFGLALSHEVNKFFRHSVSISKNLQPAPTSNFQDVLSLNYNVGWDLFRNWTVDLNYSFLMYDASSSDVSESARLHQFRVGHSWQLTKSINLTANYMFQLKEGSLDVDDDDYEFADQDFRQNVITVGLQYAF